jgi:membrane protease YdiL (CAAX protease family)
MSLEENTNGQSDSPPETVAGGTARRRLGAWSAFLIFLGYVGAQLITGAFVGLVAGVRFALSGANLQDPAALERLKRTIEAPAAVLGMVVAGIVAVLLVRYFAREAIGDRSADGIAWARGTVAALMLGFGVGGLLSLGYVLVTSLLIPPAPDLSLGPLARMAATPGTARTYWTVAALAVAPPLEEFLFRGVLFSGLARTWGRPAGALLSTALFVLLHLPETIAYWPSAIAITLLGVGALVLRIRASAVGPAVAGHFAYNLVLVVVVYGFQEARPGLSGVWRHSILSVATVGLA